MVIKHLLMDHLLRCCKTLMFLGSSLQNTNCLFWGHTTTNYGSCRWADYKISTPLLPYPKLLSQAKYFLVPTTADKIQNNSNMQGIPSRCPDLFLSDPVPALNHSVLRILAMGLLSLSLPPVIMLANASISVGDFFKSPNLSGTLPHLSHTFIPWPGYQMGNMQSPPFQVCHWPTITS